MIKATSVTAVTITLRIGDMDYGHGSERSITLRSEVPEGKLGFSVIEYDKLIGHTLDLQLQAWEAVQGSRYVGGVIKGPAFQELLDVAKKRTERVKQYLIERGTDGTTNIEPTQG